MEWKKLLKQSQQLGISFTQFWLDTFISNLFVSRCFFYTHIEFSELSWQRIGISGVTGSKEGRASCLLHITPKRTLSRFISSEFVRKIYFPPLSYARVKYLPTLSTFSYCNELCSTTLFALLRFNLLSLLLMLVEIFRKKTFIISLLVNTKRNKSRYPY